MVVTQIKGEVEVDGMPCAPRLSLKHHPGRDTLLLFRLGSAVFDVRCPMSDVRRSPAACESSLGLDPPPFGTYWRCLCLLFLQLKISPYCPCSQLRSVTDVVMRESYAISTTIPRLWYLSGSGRLCGLKVVEDRSCRNDRSTAYWEWSSRAEHAIRPTRILR